MQSRKDIVKNSLAVFVVLLVSIIGVKLLVSSHAATGATLTMTPSSTSVTAGSNVTVTINEDSGTDPVNSVQASLSYDSSQLQYVSMTEGTAFPTIAANSVGTPGVIRVGRATQGTPVTGSNEVVTLTFKVLASSGSIGLTYDKNYSFVVRSTDNVDILSLLTGTTLTVDGIPTASASMTLSPAAASVDSGSTVNVVVRSNSGTASVNSVQAYIGYDAAQLQYTGLTEGGTFTNIAATDTATAGRVRIARSVQPGSAGITGDNPVVTLSFKVLATSGTAALTIDKTQSFVVSSTTNTNILSTVAGSTYTVTSVPGAGSATFSMTPSTGTYAQAATISVVIKATSTAALTTAQATIVYPASQLQFVNTTEGTVFTTAQRTNTATSGVVDIIRSIPGGNAGVTGTNPVITLNFKVIGTNGTAPLTYGQSSALFDDSGTGANILNLANSAAANYTIATTTCATTPSTPGTPTRSASNYTTISLSWTASTAGTGCTMAGYHVLRNGVSVGDVTAGTNFTDIGLSASSSYSYAVQAFDTAGNTSTTSTAATLVTKADDMAPTTPVGVTAAAPDAVSVDLAWNPSTDFPNPGGVGINGYRIYRNGATVATYSTGTGASYTDTNVSANTTYSYTVTAFDKLGNESSPSNIASATTQPPPVTCTGVPSTPAGLTSGTSTITTTNLSWAASTASTGCTLAGYHVFRNSLPVATVTGTSNQDTGLAANTSYTYTVQAYDTSGHNSLLSTAKTIVTASDTSAPSAPSNVTATAISPGQVNLAWVGSTDNVAVTAYKIYRGGTLLTPTSPAARSFNDTTVTENTDYTYTVSAVDLAGNESAKTIALPNPVHTPSSSDTQAPTVPSGLRAPTVTTSSVILAWNASTDNVAVSGYHVYRAGVLLGDATGLSYSNTGLTADTTYTYTVKAFDASGNTSAASVTLSVTTSKLAGCIVGDVNCNGVVDTFDLSIMMTHWQVPGVVPKYGDGDINLDGKVDTTDLSILLSHLGDRA